MLPRNLEHLVIENQLGYERTPNPNVAMDEFTACSAIREWIRNWRDITPRLKSFSITLWHIRGGRWTANIRRELKKHWSRVGVEHHQDEDRFASDDAGWRVPADWEW